MDVGAGSSDPPLCGPIFWLGIMLAAPVRGEAGVVPTGGRIAPFSEPRSITGLYTSTHCSRANWARLDASYSALRRSRSRRISIFIRLVA